MQAAPCGIPAPVIGGWSGSKRWTVAAYLPLGVFLLLILSTFSDYGVTYDEDSRYAYGEYIIRWYASGFRDRIALRSAVTLEGGFFPVLARLAGRARPRQQFERGHLVNALFGLTAAFGAYRLARYLAGPLAGFLATLFLIAVPRFYGNAFNNPADIPFAALHILFLDCLVRAVPRLPDLPKRDWVRLGLWLGLALAVRPGAVLLVFYLGLTLTLWLTGRWYAGSLRADRRANFRSPAARLALVFASISAIAYGVMLLWWPAAQVRPIVQPAKALWFASHYPHRFSELFEGRSVPIAELPRYYVSKWFLITLPEYFLIALAVGVLSMLASLRRLSRSDAGTDRFVQHAVVLAAALLPLVYTLAAKPAEYDAGRHYLFFLPPLAVLAAMAVAKTVEVPRFPYARGLVLLPLGASLAVTAVSMWRLHPHQYVFFNRILGKGLPEAAKSFETDYWGNSYKEGVEWLAQNYRPGLSKPKVASCSDARSTSYFLPQDRFDYVGSYNHGQPISAPPDFLVATTRWDCHKIVDGVVIHTVERLGTPLLYVKAVSAPARNGAWGNWTKRTP